MLDNMEIRQITWNYKVAADRKRLWYRPIDSMLYVDTDVTHAIRNGEGSWVDESVSNVGCGTRQLPHAIWQCVT